MWHVFHGPDGLTRDEEVARMRTMLGAPDIASLNTAVFDGAASVADIRAAADAMPFLSERRLVVARNWLARPPGKRGKTAGAKVDAHAEAVRQMAAYLPELPESTGLVFCEDETLPPSHPLIQLAKDKANRGRVKLFDLPEDATGWVVARARLKGGEIGNPAAAALVARINRGSKNDRDHAAEDSRLYVYKLDRELDKLTAYAAGRRIEEADVEVLVAAEDVADIFAFTDALGSRDSEAAYRAMRGVLSRGEQPLIVLSMIARQTRLLIQAKENDRLAPDALAQALGVHPYVAGKLLKQAALFSMPDLERAHRAVHEADAAIKSGRMEDMAALDVLVAELCGA
jgi:DNA polymerase-3 subunit delta